MKRSQKRTALERGVYHFFIVLPNRFYPFSNQVEGQWVRGMRSAEMELRRAERRYGVGAYGYRFAAYRQIFHFLGSVLVIYAATLIAFTFLGGGAALLFLFAVVVILITYQEFYYQPRRYRQHWQKGVADWMVWIAPIAAYFFLFR